MAVENLPYIEKSVEESQPKTVTVEIPNPEHPEYWERWNDEMMRGFFEAGQWAVQALGKDRHVIVGHFLQALEQLEKEDDPEEMALLFEMLTQDIPDTEVLETLEQAQETNSNYS